MSGSFKNVHNLVKRKCLPIEFRNDFVMRHHFPSNLLLTGLEMVKNKKAEHVNTNIFAATDKPCLSIYVFLTMSETISQKYTEEQRSAQKLLTTSCLEVPLTPHTPTTQICPPMTITIT